MNFQFEIIPFGRVDKITPGSLSDCLSNFSLKLGVSVKEWDDGHSLDIGEFLERDKYYVISCPGAEVFLLFQDRDWVDQEEDLLSGFVLHSQLINYSKIAEKWRDSECSIKLHFEDEYLGKVEGFLLLKSILLCVTGVLIVSLPSKFILSPGIYTEEQVIAMVE